MGKMTNEIIDTSELNVGEEGYAETDMAATVQPENDRIEFHIQMRSYTQSDMDNLVVESAARLIVGKQSPSAMSKAIEKRCMELITQKADAVLERVTAEIIDQPLTPSFGDKKPVTMREFLGLYAREYLDQIVDGEGNLSTSSWDRSRSTRMEWFARKFMQRTYSAEIEKVITAASSEIWLAGKKHVDEFVAAQKKRLAEAIAKLT